MVANSKHHSSHHHQHHHHHNNRNHNDKDRKRSRSPTRHSSSLGPSTRRSPSSRNCRRPLPPPSGRRSSPDKSPRGRRPRSRSVERTSRLSSSSSSSSRHVSKPPLFSNPPSHQQHHHRHGAPKRLSPPSSSSTRTPRYFHVDVPRARERPTARYRSNSVENHRRSSEKRRESSVLSPPAATRRDEKKKGLSTSSSSGSRSRNRDTATTSGNNHHHHHHRSALENRDNPKGERASSPRTSSRSHQRDASSSSRPPSKSTNVSESNNPVSSSTHCDNRSSKANGTCSTRKSANPARSLQRRHLSQNPVHGKPTPRKEFKPRGLGPLPRNRRRSGGGREPIASLSRRSRIITKRPRLPPTKCSLPAKGMVRGKAKPAQKSPRKTGGVKGGLATKTAIKTKAASPTKSQDSSEGKKARRSSGSNEFGSLAASADGSAPATQVPPTSTPKLTLDELNENNTADEYEELTQVERWVRSAPDELYYDRHVDGNAIATERTKTLCEKFESTLLYKCRLAREEAEKLGDEKMQELIKIENEQIAAQKAAAKLKRQQQKADGKCCHHRGARKKGKSEEDQEGSASTSSSESSSGSKCNHSDKSNEDTDSSSSSDGSSSEDEDGVSMTRSDTANRELERRKKHPRRMHEELWHNDPGLMNDGPVCRCSAKARRFGIRHGFYPGETRIHPCDPYANNKARLYHYRITISPPKNFLISTPTVINHDGHEYIFEGFSIFSHYPLDLSLPPCKVIRFNIKYDVFVEEERFPESFCVRELLLFETYLFREILELVDLKYDWTEESGCSQFHLMPRFVRQLPDNGQEVLSMSRVLIHLLKGDREVVKEEDLHKLYTVEQSEWQNFADRHKGTIVTKWGMKPCALRVDQIDRDISGQEVALEDGIPFPLIVHFGIRPPQLSYAGNAGYQRAWRRYVKYRHLLSNMPKPSPQDKLKLLQKEMKLQAMRTASNMKRDVTVAISARNFRTTGICCDLVQHAMLIPVLVAHLRFHKCLETLERCMVYNFQNRFLLQLAMTHPSYRENFGTNPDHARNALTNCGIRQPEYGDRRIHYASTRKRGINTLINIMAKFGADHETESEITHNERLEFLGDAVVEFTTSIHLFHIFPDLEEGGLATYRAAIVQNQHLAVLAQTLNLDQYMLYAHGSDLCHDSELRHAMANCFEALMGALFLDGGIEAADRVFGATLFGNDRVLLGLWANYPKHPLQQEEPNGDRHWVQSHEVLQKLTEFEGSIGVAFNHIRLLARAFTDRSLGYNNLTKGSNQRLEFLGDTVLQLISSEYLYRHFPDHHEGHLSLLRSSLVNNRTQSHVCEDLGMPQYAMRGDPKSDMKTKDKADLLEAFLGALFIDKGLSYCITFCQVCFFPRLSNSITKQEWNDPKSKLQQCCLTLRAMDGREPDIPVYKVTESLGPTNTRTYIVAVYFRGKRLATAQGHSIQEAEMNAAAEALEVSGHLFPQLHHQRRIMDKTSKKGH